MLLAKERRVRLALCICLISTLGLCCTISSNTEPKTNKSTTSKDQDFPEQKILDDITFNFDKDKYLIKQGESIKITAWLENHKSTSIYVANWQLGITYYWQVNSTITASVIPLGFRRPKDGAGAITASPAVFLPQFQLLKPSETIAVTMNVPITDDKELKLTQGLWQIKLQHLWIDDLEPFKKLAGEKLATEMNTRGHFIIAATTIQVE